MKQIYLWLTFLCFSLVSYGQNVGIGTDTPNAKLDITGTTEGILIPRLELTATNNASPLVSPTISELIYNTATTGDVTPGYYYWGGSAWVRLLTTNADGPCIIDADNDTKVCVEESPDEDIIRFDMGGTQYFRMLGGRLETTNTGYSVFIGQNSGFSDDFSNNGNVGIGYYAINQNTTGPGNTAIGFNALRNNTTSGHNTAVGYNSMNVNTGANNASLGSQALQNNTTASNVVGIGRQALFFNTTGGYNNALGRQALYYNLTGVGNNAVGYRAMYNNNTGSNNVAFGHFALDNNISGSLNTAIGYLADVSAGNLTNATAIGANTVVSQSNSVILGNNADVGVGTNTPDAKLDIVSTDDGLLIPRIALSSTSTQTISTATESEMVYNTATAGDVTPGYYYWGGSAWIRLLTTNEDGPCIIDADNDTKVCVEESPDEDIIRFDMAGIEHFTMDAGRLGVLNSGNSVFIGEGAGAADDLSNNRSTFIGYQSGQNTVGSIGSVSDNTAIGYRSLQSNTNGFGNTAIGVEALQVNDGGHYNTATGYRALQDNTTGQNNVGSGPYALTNNTTGGNNTAIGWNALLTNTTGSENTAIGYNATVSSNNLTNATAIGASASVGQSNALILGEDADVGIGTSLPDEKLHVNEGNFLVEGTFGSTIALTANGAGTRMLFYPRKAAFRAGRVYGTQWDDANIGNYSTAMGENCTASGDYSMAFGSGNTASNTNATAFGGGTTASGNGSVSMGSSTEASGANSFAQGTNSVATGQNSVAMGANTESTGTSSTAIGFRTKASGEGAFAFGRAGEGTSLGASGDYSVAGGGVLTKATGDYSIAMGGHAEANGINSIALATGDNINMSGRSAIAVGIGSFAVGDVVSANGDHSFAMGTELTAESAYETVIGHSNTSYTPNSTSLWDSADRLFTIGNGTGAGTSASDAMVVLKNGNTGIGTSLPTSLLQVFNGDRADITLQTSNNLSSQGIAFQNSGASYTWNIYRKDAGGNRADLVFANGLSTVTGLTDVVTFQDGGNVGIGTTNPSEKLEVSGNVAVSGNITGNNIWMKIAEVDLSASAGTTITGLNGNVQKMYKVVFQGSLNANSADRRLLIRPNSVTTGYNGYAIYSGSYNGSDWETSGFYVGRNGNALDADISYEFTFSAMTGRKRVGFGNASFIHTNGTIMGYGDIAGTWTNTATNITSLWVGTNGGTLTGKVLVFALQ